MSENLWWLQFRTLFMQSLRADSADKERLLTPFLFATTVLLLFNFAFGDITNGLEVYLFVGEVYLTGLLALQMSYGRIFSPDQQDKVFELLLTHPVHGGAWFLAKYCMALIYGLMVLVPVILMSALFFSGADLNIFYWPVWATAVLSLMGLASLGILLSALTLKASGREMLFPLLYFPLTIPVLLAAIQGSLGFMTESGDNGWQWLGLLAGFDIIYFTLGILLFGELTNAS